MTTTPTAYDLTTAAAILDMRPQDVNELAKAVAPDPAYITYPVMLGMCLLNTGLLEGWQRDGLIIASNRLSAMSEDDARAATCIIPIDGGHQVEVAVSAIAKSLDDDIARHRTCNN